MADIPLQRRVGRAIIRYQARLEGGAGDRWIPVLVGVLLAAFLIRVGLDRIDGLTTGVDLAAYSQGLWLLTQLTEPRASLFGTDVHLLEVGWSFVLYLLAIPAAVFSPAKVLVVAQSVALGVAALPLWSLARRVAKLRIGAASALVGAYALHPATHRLGVDDFHPVTLAVPALIGMAYFGSVKRWVPYWICVVFALLCRADLGLAVGLWGFVLLGEGHRRAGLWTLGVGWVYSLVLLLVGQPLLSGQGGSGGATGYDGQSLGDLVLNSFRNPIDSLQSIVAQENLGLLVALLAPVVFLPLLSLRHLWPAVPLTGLYLLAESADTAAFAQRAALLLAFVMVAATFALNRLGNEGVERVFLDVRLLTTLAAAALLSFMATSATSPYENPWTWNDRDETDVAVAEAVADLDPEIPIRASPAALTLLSDRPWLFPLATDSTPSAVNMGFPAFTRAVLLVERQLPDRTEADRQEFDRTMALLGFQRSFDSSGVVLYVR